MIAWTDDPARRLKHVWKGTPDGVTWPFDARYGAWAAGVGLATTTTLGWWMLTRTFRDGGTGGALLLLAATVTVCGLAALRMRGRLPGRRWLFPLAFAPLLFILLFTPATAGGPGGALLAIALAAGLGAGGAVYIVRKVGKHIDKVTPLKYQVGVLLAEARAPRPVPPVAHHLGPGVVDTTNLGVTAHHVVSPGEI